MNKKLVLFRDHKSEALAKTQKILWFTVLSVLAVLSFFIFTTTEELESLEFLILFFGFLFMMGVIPSLILHLNKSKSETAFHLSEKHINIWKDSKLLATISFFEVPSLSYSEYSYTVSTKNGTRSVRVHTILSNTEPNSFILAEAKTLFEIRQKGEAIAKILNCPLISKTGETLETNDLDQPILKRKSIPWETYEKPTFKGEKNITIDLNSNEMKVQFFYYPKFFIYIAAFLSFAFILLIHFAFGDEIGLSLLTWENYYPNVSESIFLGFNLAIGGSPILYILYKLNQKKIWILKDTFVQIGNKKYLLDEIEEIFFDQNAIHILNDKRSVKLSLFFYVEPADYKNCFLLLMYGIRTIHKSNWEEENRF